jgi:hypothetical protein
MEQHICSVFLFYYNLLLYIKVCLLCTFSIFKIRLTIRFIQKVLKIIIYFVMIYFIIIENLNITHTFVYLN